MLEEPAFDYPLTQGKSCVCLEDGQYRAYLDRNATLELLFSFYWLARDPPGEEVSIYARNCSQMPCNGKFIGLCEFNTVPEHTHKKQGKTILKKAQTLRHKPHGIYTEEHNRLDYFVSPEEVRAAYETLTAFLAEPEGQKRRREVTLFETLLIRLVTLEVRDA